MSSSFSNPLASKVSHSITSHSKNNTLSSEKRSMISKQASVVSNLSHDGISELHIGRAEDSESELLPTYSH